MSGWFTSRRKVPEPSGPEEVVRAFSTTDPTLTKGDVTVEGDHWLVDAKGARTVRLFELEVPGFEHCRLTYRAQLMSRGLAGRAYLEMWCRLPGRGEFFSKGLDQAVSGTNDWASYETPFFLKKGQSVDLVKLNLVVEGSGRVGIMDVEVVKTPLG
jgi:hypothetical protein